MSEDKKKYRILLFLIAILGIPQFIYRFKHPEMTETHLFMNFFNSYCFWDR